MYIYNYRIFDKHRKEVVSLAILTDKNPDFKPCEYRRERWNFHLIFKFPTIKIIDYYDRWAELESDPNPFAIVVQAHLMALATEDNELERYKWKRYFLLLLYERGMDPAIRWAIFRFIDWIMKVPEEMEREIINAVKTIEEAKDMPHMTTAERFGREEGMQQGIQQVILSLVDARFGVIPEEIQEKVQAMKDAERLKQIARMLVKVQSLEELRRAMD